MLALIFAHRALRGFLALLRAIRRQEIPTQSVERRSYEIIDEQLQEEFTGEPR